MPFTLAHPAAILPFSRWSGRHGVFSALVIGSMMPDMPYFLALDVDRGDTHSLMGLLWFSLPLGCLIFGLFHGLFKRPLAFLLPPTLSRRLPLNRRPLAGKFFWALPWSIWLGSFTHIVWDACTHKYGFLVDRVGVLRILLFRFAGYNFWVYKVLQYVSGIVGMGILLAAAWWWLRRASSTAEPEDRVWRWPDGLRRPLRLLLLLVPSLVGILAAWFNVHDHDAPMLLRHMVIVGGRCFLLALSLYAVAWWLYGILSPRPAAPDS